MLRRRFDIQSKSTSKAKHLEKRISFNVNKFKHHNRSRTQTLKRKSDSAVIQRNLNEPHYKTSAIIICTLYGKFLLIEHRKTRREFIHFGTRFIGYRSENRHEKPF